MQKYTATGPPSDNADSAASKCRARGPDETLLVLTEGARRPVTPEAVMKVGQAAGRERWKFLPGT